MQKKTFIDELDEYLQRSIFNGNVLVSLDGKVLYQQAIGLSDLSAGELLNIESVFCLASLSKMFTSASVLLLEQMGNLELKDRITSYIHELPACYSPIQIKHLLTHTSGIPEPWSDWRERIDQSNTDVIDALKEIKKLDFEPGSEYAYSNAGYIILAEMIERVSGVSYADFLSEYIFSPLDMKSTFVRSSSWEARKGMPVVHSYIQSKKADWPLHTYGAGGIYSNLQDLLAWDHAVFADDFFGEKILSKMIQPKSVSKKQKYYGMGWGVVKKGKHTIVGHTGGMFGFRILYEHRMEDNLVIIILSNVGETDVVKLQESILRILKHHIL